MLEKGENQKKKNWLFDKNAKYVNRMVSDAVAV